MIEGLNQKDEELIKNLITELQRCTAEERKRILNLTLVYSRLPGNHDWTADMMFLGAFRELITRFEGV